MFLLILTKQESIMKCNICKRDVGQTEVQFCLDCSTFADKVSKALLGNSNGWLMIIMSFHVEAIRTEFKRLWDRRNKHIQKSKPTAIQTALLHDLLLINKRTPMEKAIDYGEAVGATHELLEAKIDKMGKALEKMEEFTGIGIAANEGLYIGLKNTHNTLVGEVKELETYFDHIQKEYYNLLEGLNERQRKKVESNYTI